MSEPGPLALGILAAGGLLRARSMHRLASICAAAPGGDLGNSDRAHHGQRGIELCGRAMRRPHRSHRPPAWRRSAASMRAASVARSGIRRSGARRMLVADAADSRPAANPQARRPVERTTSSARAMRVVSAGAQPRRRPPGPRRRAHACASDCRQGADCLARIGGIDLGHRRDPVEQGAEVEAGASDEDRCAARGVDLGDRCLGLARPGRGIVLASAIDMAEQPMRRARLVLRAIGRAAEDAQIAIDLACIGIDDRAADPLGERERQRALAARGRPCDERQRRRAEDRECPCSRRR